MVSLGRVELPCVPVYWLLRSRVILRSFCLVYLWKNSSGSLLIFHCSVVWVRSHWALDICFEKLPNQVTAFALTASKLNLRKLAPTLPLQIKLQHLKTVTYKQQFLNQYLNSVYSLWEICLCWASGKEVCGIAIVLWLWPAFHYKTCPLGMFCPNGLPHFSKTCQEHFLDSCSQAQHADRRNRALNQPNI